jgi:hypothetical protein
MFLIKKNYINLAKQFAYAIDTVANKLNSESVKQHLEYQIEYANQYYNWTKQGKLGLTFYKEQ